MWSDLAKQFRALVTMAGGKSKSSSGQIEVIFHDEEIAVTMGTYDIPGYPRHFYLGSFKTEEEAWNAIKQEFITMTEVIKDQEGNIDDVYDY